jgi:hypothetical protein
MQTNVTLLLAASTFLAGCSGKTLYQDFSAVAPETIPDSAYACTSRGFEAIGFKRWRTNAETREFIGRRRAEEPRQSNVLARRWFDQMDLKVTVDSAGGSIIAARAASFQETETQRGPTQEQTPLHSSAKHAADSVFAKCGAVAAK